MKTTVRQAELEDVDELVPLFDTYRQFYDQPSDLTRARNWLPGWITPAKTGR